MYVYDLRVLLTCMCSYEDDYKQYHVLTVSILKRSVFRQTKICILNSTAM